MSHADSLLNLCNHPTISQMVLLGTYSSFRSVQVLVSRNRSLKLKSDLLPLGSVRRLSCIHSVRILSCIRGSTNTATTTDITENADFCLGFFTVPLIGPGKELVVTCFVHVVGTC